MPDRGGERSGIPKIDDVDKQLGVFQPVAVPG